MAPRRAAGRYMTVFKWSRFTTNFTLPRSCSSNASRSLPCFPNIPGFAEEQERRFVYLQDRDRDNRLASMLSYSIGSRGLESRLRFKLEAVEGVTVEDFPLEKLVWR